RALAAAEELGSEWLAAEVAGLIARARLPRGGAATDDVGDGRGAAGANGDDGPGGAKAADDNPFDLTPRERQVLAALAEGATNREIAASLFMAEKTASVHVSRILAKLGVRSRTEAAAVAHRLSLV
ncbi:MAG TPA: response regulator transcription factor, partial [Solirubrobacterales bacterium]|nr:response regulator transcription factor [Solirubrobacterales bacterium]